MPADPTESRVQVLGVFLEPIARESVRVGSLLRDQAGTVNFIVDDGYVDLGPSRPILSLALHAMESDEDTIARLRNRRDKIGNVNALPPFFANLLPEGALRSVVEAQLPPTDNHEFGMLRRLGADLPGAVVVKEEGVPKIAIKPTSSGADAAADVAADEALVKFSLAGVQMKFSMVQAGDRLTLPARGDTGRVIVKLPSKDYADLPEIEYGAMMLAQAAGVSIAEIRLFPVTRIVGLRKEFTRHGKNALAVTRFDRNGERRVHMEDFAQILGAVGNQKYSKANVETMVRLVSRFTPDPAAAVLEMVRRIVVDLMLGNGDSHLKNTSFIYPDGRTPTLSPAYDIVPTVFFQPEDKLALSFGGKRNFERITEHEFERMAGYVDVNPKAIIKEIAQTVERANDTWPKLLKGLTWPKALGKTLTARWPRLALFEGQKSPFG
jgi:serine/threonine-protein kinase HipA